MLAQGGSCVLHDENDYDDFFEDTMKAGHYENRTESVDIMIRSSRNIIDHLISLGVRFDRNPDGSLQYTKEGAHSRPRICFHEDITGQEITTKLQRHVLSLSMVKEAIEAGADIIMLDNMTRDEMAEAIRIIDGRAETECSGNITKDNINIITELGVDYVSSGALTHSAPILDLSLKHLRAIE